ncbi:DNA-binding protein, excisionase family [Mycobacteroides abscessus subsp. abscessus]|uniref:helix-turn-helix domain-containing protein n=1 Tax=Mycobacteroides abscessus TaxID=36809 RepID=UPI00092767CE|nr:helix-turn-helix domain-containing protein [Mycobacteroides abscessus]SHP29475.1 DNA-binding protein, excisionase family [Mycobacteroides abscessus subsp. abscessus]SHP69901.1 DNA-binding protein, excisionase family [Mycobacteroides abscessus subsp. abscessus]SHY39748.1 DNA-binding protein, excisionase family [Mycobacteroides abscessus subsp. abscessus]SKD92670.1 DNA-binding protein, excisionase family [Mycobacteroides abscessus subsp. abscessus]
MDLAEPTDLDDLVLLTVPEAIEALRISERHFFRIKRQGRIRCVRLGYRTLIPRSEIRRLIREATGR